MKLSYLTPWTGAVKVFIDGTESVDCVAADDEAGRALCLIHDENGKTFHTLLYRDWAPEHVDCAGLVGQWITGRVEFQFTNPLVRADAEARWPEYAQGWPWEA